MTQVMSSLMSSLTVLTRPQKVRCIFQRTLNYQSWSVSRDEKHVMIVHDSISVFRYSSLAKYTVVSLEQR